MTDIDVYTHILSLSYLFFIVDGQPIDRSPPISQAAGGTSGPKYGGADLGEPGNVWRHRFLELRGKTSWKLLAWVVGSWYVRGVYMCIYTTHLNGMFNGMFDIMLHNPCQWSIHCCLLKDIHLINCTRIGYAWNSQEYSW